MESPALDHRPVSAGAERSGDTGPEFFVEASAGIFGLNAAVVEAGRESPFAITVAPAGWLEELHGFGWLRNLRAAGEAASVELARKLVEDWIDRNGSGMTGAAWKPEVLADRVSAWLVNAHFLLDAADPRFYAKVMRSLGRQVRKLDAIHHRAPPGEPRLRCLIALLEAVIATGASNRHAERLESELVSEISRQVLADGCHISRNPAIALQLLLRLLPLRFATRERVAPFPSAWTRPSSRCWLMSAGCSSATAPCHD